MKSLIIKNSESFLTGLDVILKQFIKGMESQGDECEVINLNMFDIKACRACTEDLTFDEHGRCECDDDMQVLYPKLKDSPNWIIATPFTGKIPGKLIHFLDRLSPLVLSDSEQMDVKYTGNLALISTTAHYENEFFAKLDEHFEEFSPLVSKKYIGNIGRPHSPAMDYFETDRERIENLKEAVFRLGQQFSSKGVFDNADLEIIRQPLVTKYEFEEMNKKIYQD